MKSKQNKNGAQMVRINAGSGRCNKMMVILWASNATAEAVKIPNAYMLSIENKNAWMEENNSLKAFLRKPGEIPERKGGMYIPLRNDTKRRVITEEKSLFYNTVIVDTIFWIAVFSRYPLTVFETEE